MIEIGNNEILSFISSKDIKILGLREHNKASERYVDVKFSYSNGFKWLGSVPIEYRRTGVFAKTKEEIKEALENAYQSMNPVNASGWLKEQKSFWKNTRADVTKPFFDVLKNSKWKCVAHDLPSNPNWARRIQDIKEMGYTLATNTNMFCTKCRKNTTHLILLKLPRGSQTGYEIFSPTLRKRIIKVLNSYDAFEGKIRNSNSLLPDHKFPEISWDDKTREENPDDMSDQEIKKKFQLIDNQRNQQKREVCRRIFQTGKREGIFGINYFYKGDENWDAKIPKLGKESEKGWEGTGWYDIEEWRQSLNKDIARWQKMERDFELIKKELENFKKQRKN